jgi:hypothetical protein
VTRRTTLQPADDPTSDAPHAPPEVTPIDAGRSEVFPFVILGGAILAAGIIVVGGIWLASSPAPLTQPVTQPVTPDQACPSVNSFLDVIGSYERQAKWSLAAATAQTALRTSGLCDADRAALGQKAVTLGREALFEQPPAPEDAPGQRRVVKAYTDLKSLAIQYSAPPPSPLAVAQTAYDSRLFLLATAAYADALANGDSSPQDRDVVRADYAAQYNLGLVWSQRADSTQRADGLARLATACRINEAQQLGSPEACTELQRQVGPRNKWPAPVADPLMAASSLPTTPERKL